MELEEDQETQLDATQFDTSNQQEIVENEHKVVHEPKQTRNMCMYDRIRQEPNRYGFLIDECFLMDSDESISYQNVVADSESDKWLEAMNVEM